MKNTLVRIIGAGLLLGGTGLAFGDTVLSPAKRQEALDRGKSIVAPREVVAVVVDPFHPAAFAETVASLGRLPGVTPSTSGGTETTPTGPRNDRDLLQAIAQSLKPSGYIVLGNQPSLSFGQKRVKPGGTLTITFEGNQYTLEILTIDRTNFTLRLNREEFTRTIK
jgi:hypothetical protein